MDSRLAGIGEAQPAPSDGGQTCAIVWAPSAVLEQPADFFGRGPHQRQRVAAQVGGRDPAGVG